MKKKYISEKDRLNMIIILYANIAGKFCDMLNQEMRSPKWDWNSDSHVIIDHAIFLCYARYFHGEDERWKNTYVKEYKFGPTYKLEEYLKNNAFEFYNMMLKNSGLGELK